MDSFLIEPMEPARLNECIAVNRLNTTESRCAFIRSTATCENDVGFINYVELFYCTIGAQSKLSPIAFSAALLLVLFTGLGVTADDFLCPALLVISKTLGLSQNIAGVTFLAFGNGAPDIFSSLAGIKQSRPELVIGELLGAGIFVTTVVAGSIFLNQEFDVMKRPLLRDVFFYVLATFLTWCVFWKGTISLVHSIGLIVLYTIYIIIVITSRIIYSRMKVRESSNAILPVSNTEQIAIISKTEQVDSNYGSINSVTISNASGAYDESPILRKRKSSYTRHLIHHHLNNTLYAITHECELDTESVKEKSNHLERSTVWFDASSHTNGTSRKPSITSEVQSSSDSFASVESRLDNLTEWNEFLVHICPIDFIEWQADPLHSRLIQIWKVPIYFLLTITIPVVDYESHRSNWCRLLNSLHWITGPSCVLIITGNWNGVWGGIPAFAYVIVIGSFLAILTFATSAAHYPPRYHWVFGYLGFAISVLCIYGLANEVVNLLQAIGIMFDLSDVILGLTVLAWGNSIGDFVSDLSMARQGFPRMGLSACFGGPLLNLLLGLGLPYTLRLLEEGEIKLEYTRMVTLLYTTITVSLVSTVFLLLFTGFHSKKYHGLFLITLYGVYATVAVLIETGVL